MEYRKQDLVFGSYEMCIRIMEQFSETSFKDIGYGMTEGMFDMVRGVEINNGTQK